MTERSYTVTGMTCGHCVASVTAEVRAVPGVQAVDVALDGGRLSVSGEGFTDEAIHQAVAEAGYQLQAAP